MPYQADGREREADGSAPPLGQFYRVGGRRLLLHRAGRGTPPVVFVPGSSAVGLDYLNVHDQVRTFTTSVLYDRAGTGWSDYVGLPRSATEVATELHEVLRAAEVDGPYVMVAHSLGGAYVRRFAQLFPADAAGLVCLDAFYEEWDAHFPRHLHLPKRRQPQLGPIQLKVVRRFARRLYRRMLADWPDGIREPLTERHLSAEWLRAGARERSNLAALRDELKRGGAVPDVPLIALTALGADPGQALFLSRKALREMEAGKRSLNAALAHSVSSGEHRALADARHSSIHIDRPDAVIRAIKDVIIKTIT